MRCRCKKLWVAADAAWTARSQASFRRRDHAVRAPPIVKRSSPPIIAAYARQNGIHVSPAFMIDGLVQNDMSSGDAVSAWVSRLAASWRLSVGAVAAHQHPVQAAMLAVIVVEAGLMQ